MQQPALSAVCHRTGREKKERKRRKASSQCFIVLKCLILTKKMCISDVSCTEEGGVRLGDESPSPSISLCPSVKDFVTPSVIAGDIFPTNRKASQGDQ